VVMNTRWSFNRNTWGCHHLQVESSKGKGSQLSISLSEATQEQCLTIPKYRWGRVYPLAAGARSIWRILPPLGCSAQSRIPQSRPGSSGWEKEKR
jgi:hypothetical protein